MPSNRMPSPVTAAKRPRGRPKGSKSKVEPTVTWRDSLILNPGEMLRVSHGTKKGNLDQCEVETYDVVDAQGQPVGTVMYTANTTLKPPHRTTYWVVQKSIDGKDIVNKRW